MDNPLAYWTYIGANAGFIVISGSLAGVSLHAFRRSSGQRSYAIAAIGFACVGLGGLSELVYMTVFDSDFVLTSTEYLYLQSGEDVIIALGLGLLFYAITQHDVASPRREEYTPRVGGEDRWITEQRSDE